MTRPITFGSTVVITTTYDDIDFVYLSKRLAGAFIHQWQGPGGKVEPNESFEDCAVREVLEETGMKINKDYLFPLGSYEEEYEDKAYKIEFFHIHQRLCGISNPEPDKHSDWYPVPIDVALEMSSLIYTMKPALELARKELIKCRELPV